MTDISKKGGKGDNWSSLLSELGLQDPQPADAKEAASRKDAEHFADETDGASFSSAVTGINDSMEKTGERPNDEAEKTAFPDPPPPPTLPYEKPTQKASFFDLLPKIDLFGMGAKEKVDKAFSEITDSVIPTVRHSIQETMEAIAPHRLEKVTEAERHPEKKHVPKPSTASATPADPWSALASQLGVLVSVPTPADAVQPESAAASSFKRDKTVDEPLSRSDKNPHEKQNRRDRPTKSSHETADEEIGWEPRKKRSDRKDRTSWEEKPRNPEAPSDPLPTKAFEVVLRKETRGRGDSFELGDVRHDAEYGRKRDRARQTDHEEEHADHGGSRRRGNRKRHDNSQAATTETVREDVESSFYSDTIREPAEDRPQRERRDRRRRGERKDETDRSVEEVAGEGSPTKERAETSLTWDMEDDSRPVERQPNRRRRGRSRSESTHPVETAEEDCFDDSEIQQLHRDIPNWNEAVATVVDINLTRRHSSRGNERGRGRR